MAKTETVSGHLPKPTWQAAVPIGLPSSSAWNALYSQCCLASSINLRVCSWWFFMKNLKMNGCCCLYEKLHIMGRVELLTSPQ